jgi:hypothetical protein
MMSVVEQIRANEITNVRISGTDDDIVDGVYELIEALEQNATVVSVRFDNDFLACLRNDARSKLVKALGTMPSLNEVHFEDALLMVLDIAYMLVQSKSVRALTLKNIVLQGVSLDFDICEAALYQHHCLKHFDMKDCIPAMEDISLEKIHQAGKSQASIKKYASSVPMQRKLSTGPIQRMMQGWGAKSA